MAVKIRILLVDDHKMFRDGLRAIIQRQPDMEVVAEAEDGRRALKRVADCQPDVVLMDISMPDLNGMEATRLILAERPQVKIIGLSMHSQKSYIEKMLRAGVSAYLLKESTSEELVDCIHVVQRGLTYLSPRIAGTVVREFLDHTGNREAEATVALSGREREVLQLIAEGHSSKEIADRLHISVKTVETHRKNLMIKLDLYTVAGLTKYALREGLTSLDE